MKSDRDLQSEIARNLEVRLGADARAIGVDVEDGIATLCGQVDSFAVSQLAEEAARDVDGVQGTNVDIHLALPGSYAQREHDLIVAVRRALAARAIVPPNAIKVAATESYVTLTGEVEWACQRWAALEAVAAVPGVADVQDRIVVSSQIGGEEVKTTIGDALRRFAQTELSTLGTSADGGCVKPSGAVDSYTKVRAACIAAWTTPGVKTVIADDLRVVSQGMSCAPRVSRQETEMFPCGSVPCQRYVRKEGFARDVAKVAERELSQTIRTVRALVIAAFTMPLLIAWIAAGLLVLGCGWLVAALFAAFANAVVAILFYVAFVRWLRSEALARTRQIAAGPACGDATWLIQTYGP